MERKTLFSGQISHTHKTLLNSILLWTCLLFNSFLPSQSTHDIWTFHQLLRVQHSENFPQCYEWLLLKGTSCSLEWKSQSCSQLSFLIFHVNTFNTLFMEGTFFFSNCSDFSLFLHYFVSFAFSSLFTENFKVGVQELGMRIWTAHRQLSKLNRDSGKRIETTSEHYSGAMNCLQLLIFKCYCWMLPSTPPVCIYQLTLCNVSEPLLWTFLSIHYMK